jgi:hypothetical protein
MSSSEMTNERSDRVFEQIFAGLAANPQLTAVIASLQPYIPALKRDGMEYFDELVSFASKGKWSDADKLMWALMTDEERNALFKDVLAAARDAVDAEYDRKQLVKEAAMKAAMSIILTLI